MKPFRKNALPIAAAALVLCLCAAHARAPQPGGRLVLVLVVDQMRADYLDRFRDQFSGGLKQIVQHGRIYADAYQDHAFTKTAAGHGTVLSGLFPAHSGIIGNDWYDRDKKKSVYCTDDPIDPSMGHTPRALGGTTLGDWIKKSSGDSRVIALSRKDRSAVLLGGQKPTAVVWFEPSTGELATSRYYGSDLPGWVKTFNAERRGERYLGQSWTRLLGHKAAYSRSTRDDQEGEGDVGGKIFPHVYDGTKADAAFYAFLSNTPFMDELTLDAAAEAVRAERLGQRGVTDLLALSLSSTDAVGHKFGPDSQETQDMILRLDRYLGTFFSVLDRTVGMRNVVVVLTADHGAQPLPEVAVQHGVHARRLVGEMAVVLKGLEAELTSRFGKGPWIVQNFYEGIYLDWQRITQTGRPRAEVEEIAARFLRRSPIVEDVFTRTELSSGNPHRSPYTAQFLNAFNPKNSGDLLLLHKPNQLVIATATGTDHGTPYPYDSHVPLAFLGQGFAAGTVKARARTVDIAPTLAEVLGVPRPDNLDGVPLVTVPARPGSTGR